MTKWLQWFLLALINGPFAVGIVAQEKSFSIRLKHFVDDEIGLSFDYPDIAQWTIKRSPEVTAPAKVIFTNSETKSTLVVGFLQLPNDIPDLSEPGMLQAATDDIFGSYRRKNQEAHLVSSRIVTNVPNTVKGVEVVYTDQIEGKPWKGRLVAFFKGSKRYDVTGLALQDQFDRADVEFFSVVLKTLKF